MEFKVLLQVYRTGHGLRPYTSLISCYITNLPDLSGHLGLVHSALADNLRSASTESACYLSLIVFINA